MLLCIQYVVQTDLCRALSSWNLVNVDDGKRLKLDSMEIVLTSLNTDRMVGGSSSANWFEY